MLKIEVYGPGMDLMGPALFPKGTPFEQVEDDFSEGLWDSEIRIFLESMTLDVNSTAISGQDLKKAKESTLPQRAFTPDNEQDAYYGFDNPNSVVYEFIWENVNDFDVSKLTICKQGFYLPKFPDTENGMYCWFVDALLYDGKEADVSEFVNSESGHGSQGPINIER